MDLIEEIIVEDLLAEAKRIDEELAEAGIRPMPLGTKEKIWANMQVEIKKYEDKKRKNQAADQAVGSSPDK